MSQPPPVAYAPHDYARAADDSHLSTLAICHYVWGAALLLFSCFGLIYVALGIAMITGHLNGPPPPPPPNVVAATMPVAMGNPQIDGWFGWFFVAFGGTFVLLGWTLAICTILAGRCIAKRRRRTFALVIAILNCLVVPIGTVLGVFTLVVLLRPSVEHAFAEPARA